MNKEMILAMQNNGTAFGLLSLEERDVCWRASEAGKLQCYLADGKREWTLPQRFVTINHQFTYRISPDYQPKPEIERCMVYIDSAFGLVFDRRGMRSIVLALDDPDFIAYEYSGNERLNVARRCKDDEPAECPKYVLFKK